jgi:hypothetical protein
MWRRPLTILKYAVVLRIMHKGLYCILGWVDIGTRTKVPLRVVTYLSKVSETDEKNVLKQ